MMFNIFGNTEYISPLSDVVKPAQPNDALYHVGVTDDGLTQLRLANDGMSITLTMNEQTVRKLIRLLQASIELQTTEEDKND